MANRIDLNYLAIFVIFAHPNLCESFTTTEIPTVTRVGSEVYSMDITDTGIVTGILSSDVTTLRNRDTTSPISSQDQESTTSFLTTHFDTSSGSVTSTPLSSNHETLSTYVSDEYQDNTTTISSETDGSYDTTNYVSVITDTNDYNVPATQNSATYQTISTPNGFGNGSETRFPSIQATQTDPSSISNTSTTDYTMTLNVTDATTPTTMEDISTQSAPFIQQPTTQQITSTIEPPDMAETTTAPQPSMQYTTLSNQAPAITTAYTTGTTLSNQTPYDVTTAEATGTSGTGQSDGATGESSGSSDENNKDKVLAIALGVTFGILFLVAMVVIAVIYMHRHTNVRFPDLRRSSIISTWRTNDVTSANRQINHNGAVTFTKPTPLPQNDDDDVFHPTDDIHGEEPVQITTFSSENECHKTHLGPPSNGAEPAYITLCSTENESSQTPLGQRITDSDFPMCIIENNHGDVPNAEGNQGRTNGNDVTVDGVNGQDFVRNSVYISADLVKDENKV